MNEEKKEEYIVRGVRVSLEVGARLPSLWVSYLLDNLKKYREVEGVTPVLNVYRDGYFSFFSGGTDFGIYNYIGVDLTRKEGSPVDFKSALEENFSLT